MKLAKSVEQAIAIVAIMATQENNVPVASRVFHQRLQNSITYTQKILRKLVVHEIIKSVSGNNGGFTLAKSTKDLTLYDVVVAIEGDVETFHNTGLLSTVFKDTDDKELVDRANKVINEKFIIADSLWTNSLKNQNVQDMLLSVFGTTEMPIVNWNDKSSNLLLIQKLLGEK